MAKRAAGRADVYPNRALFEVTQSAVDTLTFAQIRFGTGIFQGTALIIQRIEWYPGATSLSPLDTIADYLHFALTNRDDLTAIAPDNMNVLVHKRIYGKQMGTPAAGWIFELPIISEFSDLPGGGLIFPANPLFIGFDSASTGVAGILQAVMYYQTKSLTDADYVELVQSLIPVNI